MAFWVQDVLVLLIVGACAAVVLRQLVSALRLRGQFGNCCAKGCGAASSSAKHQDRVVFLPVESLGRRSGGNRR